MGSDCGYSCDYADQEPVERLVALVTRWCEDEERPFRLVNVRNCSLAETQPWPTPTSPQELKLVAEIFGKTLVASDAELTADYEAECDYLHNARQRVTSWASSLMPSSIGNCPLSSTSTLTGVWSPSSRKTPPTIRRWTNRSGAS